MRNGSPPLDGLRCHRPKRLYQACLYSPFRPDILKGKIALVTGGASGIGLGIARSLAISGAIVVIASRKLATDRMARQLSESSGGIVHAISLNVRYPNSFQDIYDRVENITGFPCNLLVNCAAGNFAAPSENIQHRGFWHTFQSGAVGTAILTYMLAQRNAKIQVPTSILNISAAFNETSPPFTVPYAMSKAAVDRMTKSLALELAALGIRINSIAPGPTYESAGMAKIATGVTNDIGSKTNRAVTPIGRSIYPHEIGNLASFLSSDYASAITGATFLIDGGQSAVAFPQNFFHDVPQTLWKSIKETKASRKMWRNMRKYGL